MVDYQIQENTRRCCVSGRELPPGERFYTVLVEEGGSFKRRDYSTEAWQGAPADSFGFWMGRVPAQEQQHRPRIDDEMLFDCFRRLEHETEPARINFRYVVALLLMRRKRFRFEEARQENGHEVMALRCVRSRELFQVINPRLTEEAMAAVQEEVLKVLGWE